MSRFLHGIHDVDGADLMADRPGWIVITAAIGSDPKDRSGRDYTHLTGRGYGVIVRLNNGYEPAGTIPTPDRYDDFAQRCANYVVASPGCEIVIIGNEPNHRAEWPEGKVISPAQYADCYRRCRQAIKRVRGEVEVLLAGCAPWDNSAGQDWLDYFRTVLSNAGVCDGLALHTYTHGVDPALITSEDKRHGWHWEFRVYRDQCEVMVDARMSHLPVYLTETDQNVPWLDRNNGWVQAAYAEIDSWNREGGLPLIRCLCLYRSEANSDKWSFYDKSGVQEALREVVALGYPAGSGGLTPRPPEPPVPTPEPPPDDDGDYVQYWDERLDTRGCFVGEVVAQPGQYAWHVILGQWYEPGQAEGQAQGRHACYISVLDENGALLPGVPVRWFWADGSETKETEIKVDPWLGGRYSLDFAMYAAAPSYGFQVVDGQPSDIVQGLGLGSIEQPHFKEHSAYFFALQRIRTPLIEPEPEPEPEPPTFPRSELLWPVVGPITQAFGVGGEQFGQPGHGGLDIAVQQGTPVVAIAEGEVMYTGQDSDYGMYVRLYHPSIHSHSFVAHLSAIHCRIGQKLPQGAVLADSGSTGHSTGPHVHFELRAGSRDAYYDSITAGYRQGRYNPVDAYVVTGSALLPGAGL